MAKLLKNSKPDEKKQERRGPKEKPINLEQVIYWAQSQATAEEIAGSFQVSVDTLDRRLRKEYDMNYTELLKRVGGQAKLSLRRYQFKMAEKNATMAIWLGKQWLGQKDHEIETPKPPLQDQVNLENELMRLKNENVNLREKLNAIECKTG